MTRVYSRDEEERIRIQARVREWQRAGLLGAAQAAALDAELRTDLRRTNTMLRAVLAFFAAIIAAASVGFVLVLFQIRDQNAMALVTGIAAVAMLLTAERLIANARLYRFGVEEALAMASVAAASIAAAALWPSRYTPSVDTALAVWFTVAAAGSVAVYRRFGYVYAGVAAIACAALVPFQFRWTASVVRLASAAVCTIAFAMARRQRLRFGDDFPGDEYATLQTAAWAGAYVAVNLQLVALIGFDLIRVADRSWFYWGTYIVVWAMPAAGLWLGIRHKDRSFTAANVGMALGTLVTNKSYLGWPRYSWDPMILGAVLIGTALAVRRWLASGPHGQRNGYTSERILERDRDAVSVLGTASAALHPQGAAPARTTEPRAPGFGGGRSGGGGASGGF